MRTPAIPSAGTSARRALTLLAGTSIAQAIPILASPILTRLYDPKSFGVFALFASITAILGSIATLRYEMAVMLPSEEEDAAGIVWLSILVALGISFLFLLVILLFSGPITHMLGNPEMRPWLFLAPPTILATGIFNGLRYHKLRHHNYRAIATSAVLQGVGSTILQLSFGFLRLGSAGLVLGQAIAAWLCLPPLLQGMPKFPRGQAVIPRTRALAARYRDFPLFSTGSILANTLSYHLLNFFISAIYSTPILGAYALVNRAVSTPTTLVGNAIGDVYFKRATEDRQRVGRSDRIFLKTLGALSLLAIPLFSFLYFAAEPLFAFVFGEQWREAGRYCQPLSLLFGMRFIAGPLSSTNNVFEKQGVALLWQVGLLFLSVGIVAYAHFGSLGFPDFLRIFSWLTSAYYLFLILILAKVSRGNGS